MTRAGDSKDTERDARNEGLKEEERQLHDPDERTPHATADDAPVPKRPAAPAEDSDDIAHLENPPQTDGPRERSNDSV